MRAPDVRLSVRLAPTQRSLETPCVPLLTLHLYLLMTLDLANKIWPEYLRDLSIRQPSAKRWLRSCLPMAPGGFLEWGACVLKMRNGDKCGPAIFGRASSNEAFTIKQRETQNDGEDGGARKISEFKILLSSTTDGGMGAFLIHWFLCQTTLTCTDMGFLRAYYWGSYFCCTQHATWCYRRLLTIFMLSGSHVHYVICRD